MASSSSLPGSRSVTPLNPPPSSPPPPTSTLAKRAASLQAAASLSNSNTPSSTGASGGSYQYEMRADGTVVRLRCPACGLERAKSRLGFYNHCRLSCKLLFTDADDRLLRCGLPVDPDEVPPDYFTRHPSVLKQEMNLAQLRAEIKGPQIDATKRARVKVYAVDEPVDILAHHDHHLQYHAGALVEAGGEQQVSAKIIIPTSLANAVADVQSLESRFYLRRRLVVGNEARLLKAEEAATLPLLAGQPPTHEWRLYVRPWVPPGRREAALTAARTEWSRLLRSLTLHLHPSYAPQEQVTLSLSEAETGLVRYGWGEFPLRLELTFWDAQRNKPVEHVHQLRLSHVHGHGQAMQPGAEHILDVDLDRHTELKPLGHGEEEEDHQSSWLRPEGLLSDEDALAIASRQFPLFGPPPPLLAGQHKPLVLHPPPNSLHYHRVASLAEWSKLPASDRHSLERERATALHRHLQQTQPGWSLSVEAVAAWCRERGLTPEIPAVKGGKGIDDTASLPMVASVVDREVQRARLAALKYCRYCGLAHFPQERFDLLQKNCALKPRKLHLSSRTSARDLLGPFTAEPRGEARGVKSPPPPSTSLLVIPEIEGEDDEDYSEVQRWLAGRMCELDLPLLPPMLNHVEGMQLPPKSLVVLGEVFPMPRLATLVALEAATRCFLAELMQRAARRIPTSLEQAVGRPTLITPLHVYLAAMGLVSANGTERMAGEDGRFDFLTNSHMSGT